MSHDDAAAALDAIADKILERCDESRRGGDHITLNEVKAFAAGVKAAAELLRVPR